MFLVALSEYDQVLVESDNEVSLAIAVLTVQSIMMFLEDIVSVHNSHVGASRIMPTNDSQLNIDHFKLC